MTKKKINQLKDGKSYVHFIENKLLKKTNQLFFFPTDNYSKIKKIIAVLAVNIFETMKLKNKIKAKIIRVRNLMSCKEMISYFFD